METTQERIDQGVEWLRNGKSWGRFVLELEERTISQLDIALLMQRLGQLEVPLDLTFQNRRFDDGSQHLNHLLQELNKTHELSLNLIGTRLSYQQIAEIVDAAGTRLRALEFSIYPYFRNVTPLLERCRHQLEQLTIKAGNTRGSEEETLMRNDEPLEELARQLPQFTKLKKFSFGHYSVTDRGAETLVNSVVAMSHRLDHVHFCLAKVGSLDIANTNNLLRTCMRLFRELPQTCGLSFSLDDYPSLLDLDSAAAEKKLLVQDFCQAVTHCAAPLFLFRLSNTGMGPETAASLLSALESTPGAKNSKAFFFVWFQEDHLLGQTAVVQQLLQSLPHLSHLHWFWITNKSSDLQNQSIAGLHKRALVGRLFSQHGDGKVALGLERKWLDRAEK